MSGTGRAAPRERIAAECLRQGKAAVVAGCIVLLQGQPEEVDDGLVVTLGGAAAEFVLAGHEGGKEGSWPRVWAARGLLHAWDDRATEAIIAATRDDSWRVREMAAKVVARYQVADACQAMADLRHDPVPRVRWAAERALVSLA
ncbi:MAG TPA: HEAT repeat domain-containing protein [Trebonia sp.]|nr:HEAT repeat domain-containing protein [Trebonia sp.]